MVQIIVDIYTSRDGNWMILTFAPTRNEDGVILDGGKAFHRTEVLAPLKPKVGDKYLAE